MKTRSFSVYIMGGAGQTLYTGMTGNLLRRVWEHKNHIVSGFTARYNLSQLLYYVEFNDPSEAIAYEKKLKGWGRQKKNGLIEETNPARRDLAADWYEHSEHSTNAED